LVRRDGVLPIWRRIAVAMDDNHSQWLVTIAMASNNRNG
jgi:hypothetical protein